MKMSESLRILYIVGSFKIGGCQRHVVELLKGLDRSKYELYVCTMKPGGALLSEIERLGIEVRCLQIERLASAATVWKVCKLAWRVRKEKIDIIHSFLFEANFLALLTYLLSFKRNLKFVASRRSIHDSATKRTLLLNRLINVFATSILTVCKAAEQCVIDEGTSPNKVKTIPNGVDCEKYKPRQGQGGGSKNIGTNGKINIGVIASLNEHKGHEYLIEALAEVSRRQTNIECLFVGDGRLREKLEAQARRLGLGEVIRFCGYKAGVLKYLHKFDLFVLPSVDEGMSNALLEAMACGLPVIATNVGGNAEVIIDGKTGVLVPACEPTSLAEGILRLIQDRNLRIQMGTMGRELAVKKFGIETMVQNYQEFYNRLLCEK